MGEVRIAQITRAELPELLALLSEVDLPPDGVEEHLDGFMAALTAEGRIIGCIGLERYGRLGLLRSAVVAPVAQGTGLGLRLTSALLEGARADGVEEIVLLTTTARDFFGRKFAFEVAERGDYAEALACSSEWNLPRCTSAVLMRLSLVARTEAADGRRP